jgi:hypothetical protein
LTVRRNKEAPVTLAEGASSYLDEDVPEGVLSYTLEATSFGRSGTQQCQLVLVPDGGNVPLPSRAGVDLGEVDSENGLRNVRGVEGAGGENVPLFCGPQAGSRACRRNLGGDDKYFHFGILDGELRKKLHFLVFAVLYDDPSFKGTGTEVRLEYREDPAPDSNDEADAYVPAAQVHRLEGAGKWVTPAWQVVSAAFGESVEGTPDFRLVVGGGARVCLDQVLILEAPEPPDLRPRFRRGDSDGDARVHLTDAIYKLNYLFKSGPAPLCEDAADFNDDGKLNITGAIFLLLYLFDAGAAPPSPGLFTCGPDETLDTLKEPCAYRVCEL